MADATIAFLDRYPVKGLSPQPLDRAMLNAGAHFPGDRLFAVENGPSGFDPAAPEHQPKFKFLVLMRYPELARLQTHYDDATGVLTIRQDGRLVAAGDLATGEGRATVEMFLAATYADVLRGAPQVLAAPAGFRFMDSRSGFVSLINLASLRALAAKLGVRALEPRRFRANIGVEGLPPWGEFDLVGREIGLGSARLRVIKRTERCAATHADPVRGIRDLDVVGMLQREFGHADCGVYAEVIAQGTVAVGDRLTA